MRNLGNLYQRELYQQAFVTALTVVDVALVHQTERLIEETGLALLGLLLIALTLLVADFEQRQRLGILRHEHVTHMFGKTLDEQASVEAFVDDIVEQHHDIAHLIIIREVDDLEIVLGVEHIQILNHFLVGNVALTERGSLVEDGEGIAHTTVSLLGNHGKGLLLVGDTLLVGHMLQVVDGVTDGHTLEVVDLTTTQDGGQDLMLLCRSKDEDDVCGRLFERLQESIEGSGGEHVHLVDDKHLVLAQLRWDARLLHQRFDMLYRVVRGGVELEDVERTLLVERLTRLTLVTGFTLCCRILAVDSLGEDTGASGFSHTTRTAEQIGMSQLSALDGILQRGGERRLTYDGVEGNRTVFSC